MQYEWSEDKRQANIAKHGWDFADAYKLWNDEAPVSEEYSERKGEDRWLAIGKVDSKAVFIIYEEVTEGLKRIISMRDADADERRDYERMLLRETGKEDALCKRITVEQEAREDINGNVRPLFADQERKLKEEEWARQKNWEREQREKREHQED
jgi:hypothetical protein